MALSTRQLKFVEGVALGKSAAESARAAGYSKHYARRAATNLLKSKEVDQAIADMRDQICRDLQLMIERYMAELTEGARLSKEAKQFTAAARYDELRGKLTGFLVDKVHLLHQNIDIRAALQEARSRVLPQIDHDTGASTSLPHINGPPVIDAEFSPADPLTTLFEE